MDNVLICGGSGMIGKHLTRLLLENGYSVSWLSRSKQNIENVKVYLWDIEKEYLDLKALETADYIVNLAGEGIADKHWKIEQQIKIIDSRVKPLNLLAQTIYANKLQPKAFITASAVGYYGTINSDRIFTEEDQPAGDFLGKTCKLWEMATEPFQSNQIRTTIFRIGSVLANEGGMLPKIIKPIKKGFGATLGTGKQYIPWIHIDDVCGMILYSIKDERIAGVFNAVAPEHINNNHFTTDVAKTLKKPLWLPNVPSFLLTLIFGQLASIILKGSRISANKIMNTGYNFRYPLLADALENLLR